MIHLQRPLVLALLAFLAGLLLTLRFSPPLDATFLCFALFACALLFRSRALERSATRNPVLQKAPLLLFLLAGALSGTVEREQLATDCRAGLSDGQSLRISGVLAAAHRPADRGGRAPLIPLVRSESTEPRCTRDLRVRMPVEQSYLPPGTRVEMNGRWRTFPTPVLHSAWPRDPRFLGYLAVDSLTSTGALRAAPWLSLRSAIDRRIERLFPERFEMVEALLLGRREYVEPAVRDRYARAGLAHLLAISGMHVGILSATLLLLASVARISRDRALLLNIGLIWGYLLVIGAGASALRAGVMLSLALIANLIQRPTAIASTVAAAAFIIIGTRPLALLDPGLQLSFAGVLAILYLRPPLLALLPEKWRARKKLRTALDALVVGTVAFLVTAPIAAHHFGIVAPVSILAGIPALPLMSLALIGAMAALVADLFLPGIALNLAAGADLALLLLNRLADFAAGLPYGHADLAHFSWSSLLLPMIVGAIIFRLARQAPPRLQRLLATGATLASLVLWPFLAPKGYAGLEVHFLDVGQGDAIALRTPRNRWLVVDAGPISGTFDAGERRVLPFLRDRGARRIEALVLTHPDLDHIGGAAALLRAMPVHSVFEPGLAVGKESYLGLLRELDAEVTEWRAARTGRIIELDGVRIEFLWPDAQAVDASEDANQISAVLRLVYGEFALLLTGDADAEVERVLIERHGEALEAQVLKLGHHGSITSTSEELLRTVRPRLAVVSAGRRNRYGHPAPLVVSRVVRHGIELARTDLEGSISIRVAPGGSHWSREEW